MKKYLKIFFFSTILLSFSCDDNTNKKETKSENSSSSSMTSSSESPVMSFDKTLHDFGTIQEGETVETIFTFTNSGKSDLIIVDAREVAVALFLNILKIHPYLLESLVKLELALIQATNLICNKDSHNIC